MNNFEVTIGIEVHTVLNTETKMFSKAKNSHTCNPNTIVSYMDLALPGILPIINKEAVNKAIILADALHMDINYKNIEFDRKNYFYPDLPKGFQITQQYNPIGTEGYIEIIDLNGQPKKILIERIHMEEDTAKQTIVDNVRYMDYNRAGDPLIEIVTKPCIANGYEAGQYLQQLRRILVFKNVSDAKMEEGSLRADVNISMRIKGQKHYGTKVEIKNINSINNVIKAIDYEMNRQTMLLLNNQEVTQETRRFDDTTGTTEFMRLKTDAVDYRYMTDPNVMHFKLSDDYVKTVLSKAELSPQEVEALLKKQNLDDKQITLLIDNYDLCSLFLKLLKQNIDPKLAFNWVSVELSGWMNKLNIDFNTFNQTYYNSFTELLTLLNAQEINGKQAKTLLEKIFAEKSLDVKKMIKELGFEQIKDPNIIKPIVQKYIEANPDLVKQYNERAERVEKFIVGMVMKDTNSQANPNITMDIVKQEIKAFLTKN